MKGKIFVFITCIFFPQSQHCGRRYGVQKNGKVNLLEPRLGCLVSNANATKNIYEIKINGENLGLPSRIGGQKFDFPFFFILGVVWEGVKF